MGTIDIFRGRTKSSYNNTIIKQSPGLSVGVKTVEEI